MTRILVVDDDTQIQRALSINLRAHDYEVDGANLGEDALTKAAAKRPDLVLLDLGLPGIDGLEVIAGLAPGRTFQSSSSRLARAIPPKSWRSMPEQMTI